MSLFSDAEIAQLRLDQLASFPETAQVITRGNTVDSGGGWTTGEVGTVTTTARRQPPTTRTGEEQPQGGVVWAMSEWQIGLPAGTTVGETDIIRFSDQDYEVKSVRARRSYEFAVWVDAVAVE